MSIKAGVTEKALKAFLKYTIQQARTNLTKGRKNQTKDLYNSMKYDLHVTDRSFGASISMEEYGTYQDQGVSGKIRKFNTPFSYKNKMPPPSIFGKMLARKGIVPRGKDGRFSGRMAASFAIARSIFYYGIKPSHFLSTPFERGFQKLPNEVIEAYGLDVEKFLNYIIKPK